MSINYTILKSSIINSSIWNEDAETCKVWITLLAMRNKDGEIFASMGGLAHQSRLPVDVTKRAVDKFLLPEGDSSSRDDGRRIVEVPGGWKLLNHEKIKAEASAASRQSYMAEYMREKRLKEKPGRRTSVKTMPDIGMIPDGGARAEAQAEAKRAREAGE
jgi:hypothetical protein